jgi:Na+/proline symporter
MSRSLVLSIVLSFGLVMLTASLVRRYAGGMELFLVSRRSVGMLVGSMSVAATWIWAPSLFLAAQKAYQQGLPGIAWFTVPNVLCLVLFSLFARRIKEVFPKGYTLPEYIALRYDKKTHLVYLFCFISLQICSLAVQLIAGAGMLDYLSGTPYPIAVVIIAAVFTSYSLIDGLYSSIRTEVLQLLIILTGIGVLVPMAVAKGGGAECLAAGVGGFAGKHSSLFDPYVAYSFGITVTIGLMSGPVGDQKFWQRAFAFSAGKEAKGFILGALLFGIVPVAMSMLGFIAAGNSNAAPEVYSGAVSPQQVGPTVIGRLLPGWGLVVFVLIVLSGLASTGSSALCAGGSLVAVDIYRKYFNASASEAEVLRIARLSVLGTSLVAVGIALIPGITILALFLFYGTLRSSTFLPTILTLYLDRIPSWGIFFGIALAIGLCLPLYVFGEVAGNVGMKVSANIAILIISSMLPMTALLMERRRENEMPKVQH